MNTEQRLIIKIDCIDQVGLLYKITQIIYTHNLNIISLQEHVEHAEDGKYFFTRVEVSTQKDILDLKEVLTSEFTHALPFGSTITVEKIRKKNLVIMTSKEYHCFSEILIRSKYDTLPANILAVIGNHNNSIKELCEFAKIPFHFIPSPKELPREEHEQQVLDALAQYPQLEFIILARYMRILSQKFISTHEHKIINIHHSFLPAFIGANPYKQAFKRGVKIIGATAHYATEDLDEGPIITQQTLPIDHKMTPQILKTIGRDIEKITLANALNQVLHDRVFIFKNKTIIL